jgi:lipopolysaccharide transport system permease protein
VSVVPLVETPETRQHPRTTSDIPVWKPGLVPNPSRLAYVFDLVKELVARDLKLRYKRTLLGLAWSLAHPISQLVVLGFLFSRIVPLNISNYTAFLFTSLLIWNWFHGSVYAATNAIVENADLARRPGFPAPVLPMVVVMTHFVHFLLALPILLGYLAFVGLLSPAALFLPLVVAVQLVLTLGLSYLLATLQVRFRDTQHLVGIALLFSFYLTPVFYEGSSVPARYQLLYELNPMARLIETHRRVLVHGLPPEPAVLAMLAALAVVVFVTGYALFKRTSYQFAEEV